MLFVAIIEAEFRRGKDRDVDSFLFDLAGSLVKALLVGSWSVFALLEASFMIRFRG